MTEAQVQEELQMRASASGHTLMRNSVGASRKSNRYIRYGLGGVGSPDLIGWTADARFAAVEVKRDRRCRLTQKQADWLAMAKRAGCISEVCWGLDDIDRVLRVLADG